MILGKNIMISAEFFLKNAPFLIKCRVLWKLLVCGILDAG